MGAICLRTKALAAGCERQLPGQLERRLSGSWRGAEWQERRLAIGRSQQRNTAWGPNPSANLQIQTSEQRYIH